MQKPIRSNLLSWFRENKRPLPWRAVEDPYFIWLSEVILQQTRVEQGKPYYQRFTEAFPTVSHLAEATEQEVLKLWQGLGYYSRARNLHQAAKTIVSQYGGCFPDTYEEVIQLKGIGEYTAAAILSIAFNKPYAAVDGNVYRVLARLYGIDMAINAPQAKAYFTELATELLDKEHPGDFNEAMMELGATICTPKSPLCSRCPLNKYCKAYAEGRQEELPRKLPKVAVRKRFLYYLVIQNEKGLWLRKREAGDIWEGLYDFPSFEKETEEALQPVEAEEVLQRPLRRIERIYYMKHQLTHRQLHIYFYKIDLAGSEMLTGNGFIFVPYSELKAFPLPKPVDIFLKEHLNKPKFW